MKEQEVRLAMYCVRSQELNFMVDCYYYDAEIGSVQKTESTCVIKSTE